MLKLLITAVLAALCFLNIEWNKLKYKNVADNCELKWTV